MYEFEKLVERELKDYKDWTKSNGADLDKLTAAEWVKDFTTYMVANHGKV